ncbi:MAG: branched-chain amino acid transport system substrate-binding protein, partial [Actinomycetota bacterium]|nr:branched-chain amino acid transport system substrate-binding protein [Actinomycetota bacterium]
MTRNITRVVGAVLALFMAAACGVKPSAIHDRQARDWRTGQGIAAQFNHGPGDLTVEASAKDAGPDSATSKAPPAVESPLSGDGSVQVPAPPTPTASSPVGARSPHIASSAETPASGSPAPKEAAVMGPPAPSPAPQPDPAGPAPTPAPPREALTGEPDRTGVTDTTIRIGIHAPVTGAAPFPQKAFQDSNDLYWKFLAAKGGVHGRNVEVVFRDDQYNPTSAVQACREMVEKEKVFAIIGFAGADQITACARYAETAGVPYFSGGVNEDGLAGLNRYFAISQTYDQQSATLAKLMKNRIRKTKVAIVVISTPALNSTVRSITSEILKVGGLQIVRSSRIGKNGSDAELLSEAQQLKNAGAETVYVIA